MVGAAGLKSNANDEVLLTEQFLHLFRHYKVGQEMQFWRKAWHFCKNLCVDPTEFQVLFFIWRFQAGPTCKFTRKEFCDGCKYEVQTILIDFIQFLSLLTGVTQERNSGVSTRLYSSVT